MHSMIMDIRQKVSQEIAARKMSATDFGIETPSKRSQLAQVLLLVRVPLLLVWQARFRESIAGCKCNIRHSQQQFDVCFA